MSRMTIEVRLNILIGTLLLLALAANLISTILSAGPRINAENESIVNLTRQTVERTLVELQGSTNPQRDLARLVEQLSTTRHISVYLAGSAAESAPALFVDPKSQRPNAAGWIEWIAYRVSGAPVAVIVPAVIREVDYGSIVIASDPTDELDEIAQSLTDTALASLVVIASVFALTSIAVRQALKPIGTLSAALTGLHQGDFSVRLPASGSPEFLGISTKLNDLAAELERSRSENRRLAQELISLEDQERRELAAELHDEFGPHLFAIRVSASSLLVDAEKEASTATSQRAQLARTLIGHAEAVQLLNRRVLQRLRPPALAEIGLERALEGLVAQWRQSRPEVEITTRIDLPDGGLSDTAQLTVYRIVQEGLTNAFRHAGANRIEVAVAMAVAPAPAPAPAPTPANQLSVSVADNGTGAADRLKPGFGLSGMRDRVLALGGTLEVKNATESGLVLEARLPVSAEKPARA